MPRKKKNSTKTQANTRKKNVSQIDLTFMLLVLFSIIISIIIYGKGGILHQTIDPILSGIFGPMTKNIIPIGSFLLCIIMLTSNKREHMNKIINYSAIIALISSLFSMYLISKGEIPSNLDFEAMIEKGYALGTLGKGGGVVGILIAALIAKGVGVIGGTIVIITLVAILIIITYGVSPTEYLTDAINEREELKKQRRILREVEREEAKKLVEARRVKLKLEEPPVYKQKTMSQMKYREDGTIAEETIRKGGIFSNIFGISKKETIKDISGIKDFSGPVETIVNDGKDSKIGQNIESRYGIQNKYREENIENTQDQNVEKIGNAVFTEKIKESAPKKEEVMELDADEILYEDYEYNYPPLTLLNEGPRKSPNASREMIENTANALQKTLYSFGVSAKVIDVSVGPSIARYELKPAQGVKVSKIANLADDIALNLAAETIRIEAPIPGKQAVGIEVPNEKREPVMLREVIDSDEFKSSKSKIAFALGKGVGGNSVIADIYKMPHLLVAGSTGSGKSVCVNSIVTSIIYKADPNEVKFIMIDPKVVELSIYNQIPHLLIPVITEPLKAAASLKWAVQEMLKRYQKFSKERVKDIDGYNKKQEKEKRMPKIVILIDELADLMLVAAKEVEDSICRVAQMGRAAGMHLVIATQRPSVDVITGLIKANIPSRIAFAVSSGIDSRTILDGVGAEKLLGKGDMLYAPIGATKPTRVQGAFISEEEIANIVDYIKRKDVSENSSMIEQEIESSMHQEDKKGPGAEFSEGDERDPLLIEAIEKCIMANTASTSFLRRKFRMGDARAGRMIDQMEEMGIISAPEGNKPRKVLVSTYQWEQIKERFVNGDMNLSEGKQLSFAGAAVAGDSESVAVQVAEEMEQKQEQDIKVNTDGTVNSSMEEKERIQKIKDEQNSAFRINRGGLQINKEFVEKVMDYTIEEPYFMDAIEDMIEDDEISVGYLKRKYKITEERAKNIMDIFADHNMISMKDYDTGIVTITKGEWETIENIFDSLTE